MAENKKGGGKPSAKKPGKKPRHTQLVVPGAARKKKKPPPQGAPAPVYTAGARGQNAPATPPPQGGAQNAAGQSAPQTGGRPTAAQMQTGPELPLRGGAPAPQPETETPPQGAAPQGPPPPRRRGKAIKMPAGEGKRRSRRKKRLRRLRVGVALAVVAALVLVVVSGVYMNAAVAVADLLESARYALTPGGGFPMEFAMAGYKEALPMGGGFAVLGDRDLSLVSSGGFEIRRVQHGYVRPAMATGNNRLLLYHRGNREYLVEGRGKNIKRATTEQEILFATMAANGRYAVCTGRRNSQKIEVYGPTTDWEWTYTFKDAGEIPVMASFASNNKTLAVGTLQAKGGVLCSRIYLLHAAASVERAQDGVIETEGAIPLHIQYTSGGRLLVVYDTGFAALYNNRGEEMARYNYEGLMPLSVSSDYGVTALLFGSDAQDTATLVMLDKNLAPLGQAALASAATPTLLAANGGVLVLAGQQVSAYSTEGALVGSYVPDGRAYGLVKSNNAPVLLCAGSAQELGWLLQPGAVPPSSAPASQPAGAGSGVPQSAQSALTNSASIPQSGKTAPQSPAGAPA